MQKVSETRVRLTTPEAQSLSEGALRKIGYDAEEARIIADHCMDAALCGYEYSGLPKILNVAEHRQLREPRRPIRAIRETPLSALLDGGNNNGMVAMYRATQIAIEKAIPVAAGLGGGSSDAAAVLRALNAHFHRALSPEALAALGAEIGKDLPFFLQDSPLARISGMGERVVGIAAMPRLNCLLVNPGIAVPTAEAYAALRRELWFMDVPARVDRSAAMASALAANDMNAIVAAFYNDFELVAERAHPVLKEVKQALLAFGARGALMSGSGPTLFGLFDAEPALANAEAALRALYPAFVVAHA